MEKQNEPVFSFYSSHTFCALILNTDRKWNVESVQASPEKEAFQFPSMTKSVNVSFGEEGADIGRIITSKLCEPVQMFQG